MLTGGDSPLQGGRVLGGGGVVIGSVVSPDLMHYALDGKVVHEARSFGLALFRACGYQNTLSTGRLICCVLLKFRLRLGFVFSGV